jgi:multisubunit Na+/H+ antiporter MnhC subunit
MKPAWTRRQWTWYWLFILAVMAGILVLERAIAADDRPIVLALVLTAIGVAVGIGLLVVMRAWRER